MNLPLLIAANAAGWAAVQMAMARAFVKLKPKHFAGFGLYRVATLEARLYRTLGVRRWKSWLPDGAGWVGSGFSKQRLERRDTAYLRQFELETRRAELCHWTAMLWVPLFVACNPAAAAPILCVYAAAANLPCVVAQRYNRSMLQRLIASREQRSVTPRSPLAPSHPAPARCACGPERTTPAR